MLTESALSSFWTSFVVVNIAVKLGQKSPHKIAERFLKLVYPRVKFSFAFMIRLKIYLSKVN